MFDFYYAMLSLLQYNDTEPKLEIFQVLLILLFAPSDNPESRCKFSSLYA